MYWKLLYGVPLGETLSHRVLWSLVTVLLILAARRSLPAFAAVLRNRRKALLLGVSAFLIGSNWSIYIYAIYVGKVVEASLGYYVNPLMSVGLGVALFRERLSGIQSAAIALAACGVAIMGWNQVGFPWVALGLALTFALYGLAKKRLQVDTFTGLSAETLWLSLPASAWLLWSVGRGEPQAFLDGPRQALLLIGTGAVTLAPLACFNAAARRLPLSTLGFFQYLSPSVQLLIAVTAFHEPFTKLHGWAFGFIWAALGLYSLDLWRKSRPTPAAPPHVVEAT